MNIENIIPELVLEIFSRLPIRSVCVVKCVCKKWYDLSRDPRLARMHMARSEEAFILAYWNDKKNPITTVFMTEHYASVKPLCHFSGKCRVEHSFDGLLLACDFFEPQSASVANPLTGEHLILPPCRPSVQEYVTMIYGLGFDSSIKKYKVLCAYFGDFGNEQCHKGAQVYTIGTSSSSWREIVSQPAVPIELATSSVFTNGARHWMIDYYTSPNEDSMVISFDFENEEFKTIPRQGFFRMSDRFYRFNLMNLRGSLGIIDLSVSTHIDIWKLKEYERNEFVREYRIALHPEIEVLGLMAEDEIVMVRYYDPDDEEAAVFAGDAGAAVLVGDAVYSVAIGDLGDLNAPADAAADAAAILAWVTTPQYAAWFARHAAVFDGNTVGPRAVLMAYNPKTTTLRNIHRFNGVSDARFLLHRGSLVSLSS